MSITRLSFLGLSLFAAQTSAVTCTDFGNGVTACRLEVVQDVTLESGTTNYNGLDYLLIGEHPDFPLKRSLLQFEDLPSGTPGCTNVEEAWMYVNFHYAHKASWHSVNQTPYVQHKAQLHMVNEPWDETEATSTYRLSGVPWSQNYLALDGTDAEASVLSSEFMNIAQPSRFVEFKVKKAVKRWVNGKADNYGLLIKVQDEDLIGRDLRFYSNAYSDSSKHAFINVICT